MKTIRLGATALEISEIGLGGIPIIPLQQEEAVSVVRMIYKENEIKYNVLKVSDFMPKTTTR